MVYARLYFNFFNRSVKAEDLKWVRGEKKGEREGGGGGGQKKREWGLTVHLFFPSPLVEKLGVALAGACMYSREGVP